MKPILIIRVPKETTIDERDRIGDTLKSHDRDTVVFRAGVNEVQAGILTENGFVMADFTKLKGN